MVERYKHDRGHPQSVALATRDSSPRCLADSSDLIEEPRADQSCTLRGHVDAVGVPHCDSVDALGVAIPWIELSVDVDDLGRHRRLGNELADDAVVGVDAGWVVLGPAAAIGAFWLLVVRRGEEGDGGPLGSEQADTRPDGSGEATV